MIDLSDNSAPAVVSRLHNFEQRLASRCAELGRPRSDVTLIVVTKFQDVSVNLALAGAGQLVFGESRHQEARHKIDVPGLEHAQWHFIGQLQSNKARQVASYISALHSLDRLSLLKALASTERERDIDCFVQINLTDDPNRGGVNPDDIESFSTRVLETPGLNLVGVMGVPAVDEPPQAGFDRLCNLRERVLKVSSAAKMISAGMSGDWEVALEYGATHLRVGTTITGNRPRLP